MSNFFARRKRMPSSGEASQAAPTQNAGTPVSAVAAETPEVATFTQMSTDRALWRIAKRSLDVGTVIDVGASNGMWSAVCERHLPQAHYFLVEAQPVHKADLEAYCAARKNAEFILAAAGDSVGEIFFDDSDPFGGVASRETTANARTVLPVTTLDKEARERNLAGPYLVKLDTHGFEVPILEGAKEVLKNTSLVIIETYNFRLSNDALMFHEMVGYMRDKGYGVIDVSEPLWRGKDLAFWQMDIFFQPLTRSEFAYNAYR